MKNENIDVNLLANKDVSIFKIDHSYYSVQKPVYAVINNIEHTEIDHIKNLLGCMQLLFETTIGEDNFESLTSGNGDFDFTYEENLDMLCTFFGAERLDITPSIATSYDDKIYSLDMYSIRENSIGSWADAREKIKVIPTVISDHQKDEMIDKFLKDIINRRAVYKGLINLDAIDSKYLVKHEIQCGAVCSNPDSFTFKICRSYFLRNPVFAVIEKSLSLNEIEEIKLFLGFMQLEFESIYGYENWHDAAVYFTYEEMLELLCTFFEAKALDLTYEEQTNCEYQYKLILQDIDDKHMIRNAYEYHLENLKEYPFYYCELDMYSIRANCCSIEYSDEVRKAFKDRFNNDERIQQFFKKAFKNPCRTQLNLSISDV